MPEELLEMAGSTLFGLAMLVAVRTLVGARSPVASARPRRSRRGHDEPPTRALSAVRRKPPGAVRPYARR